MSTLERLVVELATDATEYNRGLAQASSSTSSWGGKLAGIAGKAALGAMAAAGAAIAGVGVAGVKEFVGFQDSMNEVFTLLPGMSADAMGKMQEDVKGFAKEFGVLPKETVPALYQAISAGVPKDNVFAFLETAQKAARGGVTSLESAVDGISSTVNAYGTDVIDAAKASDLMFTAVKLGKTTFEELSASLFNVNPTAAALGVQFGDVTAALAAMTAQGVPTSVATTQLRQLLVEVSKEGSKTADMFQELAGKNFRQFVAEGGNVQGALQLLEQHAGSMGVGINDLFGSVEAGNAALALTGKGTQAFSTALGEMASSSGATQAAFDQMNGGIGASLDRLKAGWNTTLLDVGEKAAPAFEMLVGAAEKALPVVGEWFVWVADKAAQGVQWITDNWPAISETVMGVVDRVKGVLDGVLGPSLDNAQGTFAWVKDWIDENMPLVRKTIETVVGAITKFWDANGERIIGIVRGFMSIVARIFDTYLKNAFDVVKVIMQLITGDFEGAGETLRGIAERTFRAIFEIIGTYLEMARQAFGDIDWAALGKSIIDGIVAGVRGAAHLLGEAAKGAAQGALDGVKGLLGIHSPSAVMAAEVGEPMAEGIGVGFRRAMAGLGLAVDVPTVGGMQMPSLGRLSVPVDFAVQGLELPQQALSVPVGFDVASLGMPSLGRLSVPVDFAVGGMQMPSLGGLSVPVDFAVSGLDLPKQALSVPVDFDIPEIVLPPMTQEVALDFAGGRSSGFDVLGKSVFSSREMVAGLKQAGGLAARMAESGAAQLATLRAGIGQQAKWIGDLLPGLRSQDEEQRSNASLQLEAALGMLRESLSFDFSPGVSLPDGLLDWSSGQGSQAGQGQAGQTNYFTFNISAKSEAEAKSGVLSALRQAGVAFA